MRSGASPGERRRDGTRRALNMEIIVGVDAR